jgi:hypothetical protein
MDKKQFPKDISDEAIYDQLDEDLWSTRKLNE